MREDAQVVILECGSKSTPLIASVCRDLGVSSWIMPSTAWEAYVQTHIPKAVIISGGPDSVYDPDAIEIPFESLMRLNRDHGTAILNICYGAQAFVHKAGGHVAKAVFPEIGVAHLSLTYRALGGYRGGRVVMNHADDIISLPFRWERWGFTAQSSFALFGIGKIVCTLFHPEMDHTEDGDRLLAWFLYTLAVCRQDHNGEEETFVDGAMDFIREKTEDAAIVVGVSGGVDSAVAFELCRRASQGHVYGIFVDNGFQRESEVEEIRRLLGDDGIIYVDAREQFWDAVERIPYSGYVMSPHHTQLYFAELRRVIGDTFVQVFQEAARDLPGVKFLAQGTNWSDVQESATGFVAHHNVGGLPELMDLDVLEPLAYLHKWEIRKVAAYLGLDQEIVWRQPSPGPGNALRMWPPVNRERAEMLGRANRILEELIRLHYPNHESRPSQYFVGLLPGYTRGLVGDKTVYGAILGVRAVKTSDHENYATVEGFDFAPEVWTDIERRLRAEVKLPDGTPIVRVVQDRSSKPSAAVEWH